MTMTSAQTPPRFRSIWVKVFGLTSALVTVMLIAASVSFVISYFKVNDVKVRVTHLAHRVLPLAQVAANIDVHSLEEELYLERMMRLWSSDPDAREMIDVDREQFMRFETLVQEELVVARRILDETLAEPQFLSPLDAIQFGRIGLLLENIEKEHGEYFRHALGLIDDLESADTGEFAGRLDQLQVEADHLNAELLAMLLSLEQLNSTQAEEIEAAESMILGIYQQNFILTFIVFLVGIVISARITTRLVNPVRDLKAKSEEISKGNLNIEVIPSSHDEVGQLAFTFNHMAQELRFKNQVKELFGKYVDPRIVDSLLGQGIEQAKLSGNNQEMTVFFSDVEGFSKISESLTPGGLVRLINHYLCTMTEPILEEKGVIDKYIGDSIMAFWGPPFTGEENHAVLACQAALAQFQQLSKLHATLPEILGFRKGLPDIHIRVGLATGDVLTGNIGSENSKSYTVMGDAVNLASRLESLNKHYHTRILIDERTRARIDEHFELREIDRVAVAGKDEVTTIYELFALAGTVEAELTELFRCYEAGLAAYRSRDWNRARDNLSRCLELHPEDGPSLVMMARIKEFENNAPPADWNGIWHFKIK
ncbi:MAG TPA: HAMP domain-containing protein [Pseudohongiella sp.]|nr:HAMP domain-containing protein [Pseudohongiella sp.]